MKKVLLLFICVWIAFPGLARDFSYTYEGQTLIYTVLNEEDKTCMTKEGGDFHAGNSISGDLVIPAVASDGNNNYSVIKIGKHSFYMNSDLESVVIPNSVRYVGWGAFALCRNMARSAYPSSLQEKPFPGGCTTIVYPADGTIEKNGFIYNHDLSVLYFAPLSLSGTVVLPSSVEIIGSLAFCKSAKLESIILPKSLKSVGSAAFSSCTGLIKIAVPNTMHILFDSGTIIGYPPDDVIIEDGVIYNSDKSALYFVPLSLSDFEIPNTVKIIKNNAFAHCQNIWEFTIPTSVTTIAYRAFYNCTNLYELRIPSTITTIEGRAFEACNTLLVIHCQAIAPPNIQENSFSQTTYNYATLHLSEEASCNYSGSEWSQFKKMYIGGYPSKHLSDGVFNYRVIDNPSYREAILINGNYGGMDVANIPDRIVDESSGTPIRYYVTAIGPNAFNGCRGLSSITINESRTKITEIGMSAFQDCTSLTSYPFNEYLKTIGNSAFQGCTNLTSITFNDELTTIGNSVFKGCRKLKHVSLPNSLSYIGEEAFSECDDLNDVSFGLGFKAIFKGMFSNCNGLQNIDIPTTVTTIGDDAFNGCRNLSKVVIPALVSSIGKSAFNGCSKLTEIAIPTSVISIGDDAFNGCALSNISIGAGLASLGENAFKGSKPTRINITAQTPPIASNNSFSYYSGMLCVQDPGDRSVLNAYYDSDYCWYRFHQSILRPATNLNSGTSEPLKYEAGTTQQLYATVEPDDASLPYVFWYSTNPAVASVDNKGLVTYHRSDEDLASCKIIASTLYANFPSLVFTTEGISSEFISSGIDDIVDDTVNGEIDFSAPVDVYNISGSFIGNSIENLVAGIYIVRQGNKVKKILIK